MNSLSTQPAGKKLVLKLVLGVAVACGMAGCATVAPRTAEAIVKDRAQARWDELVKGNTNAAYGYMSPGSRSIISATDYAASIRQGFWKSAVVEKVECGSAQSCEAMATIEYEHMGRRTKTPLRESWIREGSEWWYLRK